MEQLTIHAGAATCPVLIRPGGRQTLLIGGGALALDQLHAILDINPEAHVRVLAPEMLQDVRWMQASYPHLVIDEKPFEPADLDGADLVILATTDGALSKSVLAEAGIQGFNTHLAPVETAKKPERPHKTPLTAEQRWKRLASKLVIAFALMVLGHIVISTLPLPDVQTVWQSIRQELGWYFFAFVITGFLAQMVDGALGMGYGVISAICLISAGISPVSVSAAVHTSEVFSSGISGYSHYRFGNINKKLFKHLVIPGVLGAVLGAGLLIYLGEKAGSWLMPLVAVYALFLGVKILNRALRKKARSRKIKRLGWLAGAGGFLDSFGGGGWGPIVTSTLISKGRTPRYIIGSVSLTEFFITLASAFTFFAAIGTSHWQVVLGLLIGGGAAAPIAARLAGKIPAQKMLIGVGIMVIIWSLRILIRWAF